MQFAYQYVNIVGLAKWFPLAGNVSFGAGLAVDVACDIANLVKVASRYYWSATNTVEGISIDYILKHLLCSFHILLF